MKKTDLLLKLREYDIISFDIFDTLVTRVVLRPTDIYRVVESIARKNYCIDKDFYKERIAAEKEAYGSFGDSTNLKNIYYILESKYNYSSNECKTLFDLEISTEIKAIIPRAGMADLIIDLLNIGKKVILVSDMYLSKDIIQKALDNCGFPAGLEIWVSNEKNASKSKSNLWKLFFDDYDVKKSIHVGDNDVSDFRNVNQLGGNAILLKSSFEMYNDSKLAMYLNLFDKKTASSSLLLGFIVNKICFNSPFEDTKLESQIIGAWLGCMMFSFMDWLVSNKDDSVLLFITREGYILKPLYDAYCETLDIKGQPNTLFYASRTATTAASIRNVDDITQSLNTRFHGSLYDCVFNRFNYELSNDEYKNIIIDLPAHAKKTVDILKPEIRNILEACKQQRIAYKRYMDQQIDDFSNSNFTVVDVGYTGTAQYNLSKILGKNINGKYIFLKDKIMPDKLGCRSESVAKIDKGVHPVYNNLQFLEAALQVPYGQLKQLKLSKDGAIEPIFADDKQESMEIINGHRYIQDFVVSIASWKKDLKDDLTVNIDFCEAVFILFIKFNYLPKDYLINFFLPEQFTGDEFFKYDIDNQVWVSKISKTPISFSMASRKVSYTNIKYLLRKVVIRYIPYCFYEGARSIWINYLK